MHLLLTLDGAPPNRPDVTPPSADVVTLVPLYVRRQYTHVVSKRADAQALITRYSLTEDDVLAIIAFTAEQPYPTYRWFNAWLNTNRRDAEVKKHVGPYFVLLFRALQKLPVQVVSASRGVCVDNIPKLVEEFDNHHVHFAADAFVGHWGLSSYST
eukprot:CAMPEP_0198317378 /NCGR_PEP_ID=MMETSP1450-20131203/6867_1 /TAXON_ID=753684 ORGANISM="Madagascaria erythrocladiodes, Strain CCMP3234" /NCGR_SAMPLE_ID=MMETSP1450 /ASSEMBLY_ACC=CAM_ASM_001115 /LENGTH=155 /DNA_ID=CAMNT_0044020573 /DNA_START=1 /DNA_END=464 /DNA_ORIENTATION=-